MSELEIDNRVIAITHGDKLLFPKANITKHDLIQYYLKISDYILPFIKDRPLTLNCFPNGVSNEGFVKQHITGLPEWFESIKLPKKSNGEMEHILCQNKASLIYLINQNTITIHRWLSKIGNINHPDIMIIDLDAPLDCFYLVCKAAKLLKSSLENKGYTSFVMLTGSKGLHVVVPLHEHIFFEEVREFLYKITLALTDEYPDEFSTDIRKKERQNKVYFDLSRNAYGQTAVAPFSVRASENASIAMPIDWDELNDPHLTSNKYSIKNIFKYLEK